MYRCRVVAGAIRTGGQAQVDGAAQPEALALQAAAITPSTQAVPLEAEGVAGPTAVALPPLRPHLQIQPHPLACLGPPDSDPYPRPPNKPLRPLQMGPQAVAVTPGIRGRGALLKKDLPGA